MTKDKKINLLILIPLLLTLVLILGGTYALFKKNIITNKAISIKTGTKYIGIYGENKENIEIGETYTFTIENRGVEDSGYELYLESETNINLDNITYTITYENNSIKAGTLADIKKLSNVISSNNLKINEKRTIKISLSSTVTGIYNGKLKILSTDYFLNRNFDYTGASQTFTVPTTGTYKVELWGAQGYASEWYYNNENAGTYGGAGAYVSGTINLKTKTNLYIYVGQYGLANCLDYNFCPIEMAFNGGARGGYFNAYVSQEKYGSGGGATDVRLLNGLWDNNESLASRLIVAAGGGASDTFNTGSQGGALTGISGDLMYDAAEVIPGGGGTQTSGGSSDKYPGSFGKGGIGVITYAENPNCNDALGSGGGYYGGGGASSGNPYIVTKINGRCAIRGYSGGGSSYISGHLGCVAITSQNDITPKVGCSDGTTDIKCSYHYSGYIFDNTKMIDGASQMPTYDGESTMIGNYGNGYAKITFIGQ